MGRSSAWHWLFWSLVVLASFLLTVGAILPTAATEWMYDHPPEAQGKVDAAQLNIVVVSFNVGTPVRAYGTVNNLSNVSDLGFIPAGTPIDLAALQLKDFSGLVLFVNKLHLVNGEIAVVEGFYYRFTVNNTSYGAVIGSDLWAASLAIATGLSSGSLKPANVFRPWWDTASAIMLVVGACCALGAAIIARWPRAPSEPSSPSTSRSGNGSQEKPPDEPPPPRLR